MAIPLHPAKGLDRIELVLRQSRDSLCWALVEDSNLCHSELLLHQYQESLTLIDAARRRARPARSRLNTVGAWLDGPDLMRAVFRVISSAIAAGNEEIWIGLPEETHQFSGLLQLLLRPTELGIRIVRSKRDPFIESCLGEVHTLLVRGEPRWVEGWEPVFARWGMRVHVEGPANDAILVFEDVNPSDAAQRILEAALRNSGRDPHAPHRIYAARGIHSQLCEALIRRARMFRLGPCIETESELGPLPPNRIQRLLRNVEKAVEQGARLQTGGEAKPCGPNENYGLPPTILTGCRSDMALVSSPVRGPILAMIAFDEPEDGIRRATIPRGGHAITLLGRAPEKTAELTAHFGRVFRDRGPLDESRYAEQIRWGSDARTSWIWVPMPDGRLARRAGAHDLVDSLTPREERVHHPGVTPVSSDQRMVQGICGPDGLILLPG